MAGRTRAAGHILSAGHRPAERQVGGGTHLGGGTQVGGGIQVEAKSVDVEYFTVKTEWSRLISSLLHDTF